MNLFTQQNHTNMKGIFSAILAAAILVACNEPETVSARRVDESIKYTVEAIAGDCAPSTMVVIALVDDDDKFENVTRFDCKSSAGSGTLDTGDVLEIRMWDENTFDKSMKYHITITDGDHIEHFDGVDYTGAKYTVR